MCIHICTSVLRIKFPYSRWKYPVLPGQYSVAINTDLSARAFMSQAIGWHLDKSPQLGQYFLTLRARSGKTLPRFVQHIE